MPTTTSTSWSSEIRARHAHLEVAEAVGDPEQDPDRRRTGSGSGPGRRGRCETTAPTVDSERCSAIGPSSSSSANRISPSLPGGRQRGRRCRRGGAGTGDAPGDAPAAAAGRADGGRDRATRLRPSGLRTRRRARGARRAGRIGRTRRGRRLGSASGPGHGAAGAAASLVRISMKPSPVLVTVASTPCASNTSLDLLRRDVLVLEPDRPHGAAGEVDGELEALPAAGERARAG